MLITTLVRTVGHPALEQPVRVGGVGTIFNIDVFGLGFPEKLRIDQPRFNKDLTNGPPDFHGLLVIELELFQLPFFLGGLGAGDELAERTFQDGHGRETG